MHVTERNFFSVGKVFFINCNVNKINIVNSVNIFVQSFIKCILYVNFVQPCCLINTNNKIALMPNPNFKCQPNFQAKRQAIEQRKIFLNKQSNVFFSHFQMLMNYDLVSLVFGLTNLNVSSSNLLLGS
jgi:hypothetical protein